MLNGKSFATTSQVWTSSILEWLKLRDKKIWRRDLIQWHNLPTEFHKRIYQMVQKLMEGQTDRMVMSLAYIYSLGRKVG
jgi:hypothetical protein